jgi:hypothetical protein
MRWVKVWVEVGDGVRILGERLEPPAVYHKRRKNVYLVTEHYSICIACTIDNILLS